MNCPPVSYLDKCISALTHELKPSGLRRADQPSVTEPLIDLENKQNRKKKKNPSRCGGERTQKRAVDGEEAWNVILCYQNNITCMVEKKRKKKRSHIIQPPSPTALHWFWPHCWSPVFINHRYLGAFECIIWFSLMGGQLSQDVCPPVPVSLTQRKLIHRSGIWSVCMLILMLKPHGPLQKTAADFKTQYVLILHYNFWKRLDLCYIIWRVVYLHYPECFQQCSNLQKSTSSLKFTISFGGRRSFQRSASETKSKVWTFVPESPQIGFHQQWWLFIGVYIHGEASLTAGTFVFICATHAMFIHVPQTAVLLYCRLAISYSTHKDSLWFQ